MSDEVEVFYITEKEDAEIRRKVIAQIKEDPRWYEKLAHCHLKCSDFDKPGLSYHAAFTLTDDDVRELYDEAEILNNGGRSF